MSKIGQKLLLCGNVVSAFIPKRKASSSLSQPDENGADMLCTTTAKSSACIYVLLLDCKIRRTPFAEIHVKVRLLAR